MLKHVSHVGLWVHDQDEALAFYTEKLGFEVREDVTLKDFNNYRWLTVGLPGEDLVLILSTPSAGPVPPEMAKQLVEITAQGGGAGLIIQVDDCRAATAELKSRGVEWVQEPVEQFYGVDASFRDPSGNQHRLVERKAYDVATLN